MLEFIELGSTQISDAGVDLIQGWTWLEMLTLANTKISRTGLKRLKAALPKGPVRIFVSTGLGTLFATCAGHPLLVGDGEVVEGRFPLADR